MIILKAKVGPRAERRPPSLLASKITVDLVIFACLDFREFVIWGLFTKSRIRELSISMIGMAQNNNFREILYSSRN